MPRRGRHRTSLPMRLIGIVTALLLIGGGVAIAGSAFADDDGDGGSSDKASSQSKDSGSDDEDSDEGSSDKSDKSGSDEDSKDKKDEDKKNQDKKSKGGENGDDEGNKPDESQKDNKDKDDGKDAEEFAGRDEIAKADDDDYVDITEVDVNGNRGEGGVFGGGSYSVNCGVSDHNNSDNYMAAPGKANGAQHVHDYVGSTVTDANTDHGDLEQGGTSCRNGDKSTFFWPIVRDLNGTGPDVGEDGGSLDGNVGAPLKPRSAELTFHGHPGQDSEPLPVGLMMIMGNAKAKKQDGDNANAKYTCSGFEDRVTDKYPICPAGSKLKRMLDYPSCWDGKNLESKDFRSHIFFTDDNGRCDDDQTPVPQLRVTLTYDQPAGRNFAIDSFPDNQHDPTTDHSDYENAASEDQNEAGAACINSNQRCRT